MQGTQSCRFSHDTIRANLRQELEAIALSITDQAVADLLRRDAIITGGCIASMLIGEPVKDYDIYLDNLDTCEQLTRYYAAKYLEWDTQATIEIVRNDDRISVPLFTYNPTHPTNDAPLSPYFFTENSITLNDNVQIVIRFVGDAAELCRNFDFVHCTCYWHSRSDTLSIPDAAMESILQRTLRYTGSSHPVGSLMRARRFIKRGWTITSAELLPIINEAIESGERVGDYIYAVPEDQEIVFMNELRDKLDAAALKDNGPISEHVQRMLDMIGDEDSGDE